LPVQGALRPLEHLDAFEVEADTLGFGREWERNLIDIDATAGLAARLFS
jgi:hypothetical protein